MKLVRVLLCAIALPLAAQDSGARDRLTRWLDAIAQKQLAARAAGIAAIDTVAKAEERKQYVRAKILELIGGLPDYDGPLNARVTKRIPMGSYTIENVIFESLPRLPITANLYRPNATGRHPGILFPLGHWDAGKPAAQRMAANLARKGFVVLAYDPLGQGERLQAYDARLARSLAGGSTEQHFLPGAQSVLAGESFARYRIWDARRALDYLVSRPEVDAGRIGCTGCSGGGTVTTYISALDPRIKVAAPACYMNSYQLLMSGPTGDSEQSLPGFVSAGLDLTDYVELFAPKPWLMASTEADFFTPAGARIVYEEARRWYRLFGAEEKVKWVVGPGGHGTPLEVREAIYEWMIRYLRDGDGSGREETVELLPNHELLATNSGQVAGEVPNRDVSEVIFEGVRARRRAGTQDELRAEIRRLMGGVSAGKPITRPVEEGREEGFRVERLMLETEPGLEVSATLLTPDTRKGAVLMVETGARLSDTARRIARAGNVVLALSPRGTPAPPTQQLSGDWISNTRAWLVGRNLPGMRALDIVRGVDLLVERSGVGSVRASARGVPGVWLLLAAVSDPRIASIWLDGTPHAIEPALAQPLHRNLHDVAIPGFALRWDVSDVVRAIGARPLLWSDPSDWLGNVVKLTGNYKYRSFEEPDDRLVAEFLK